jgi:hypothetical protein
MLLFVVISLNIVFVLYFWCVRPIATNNSINHLIENDLRSRKK